MLFLWKQLVLLLWTNVVALLNISNIDTENTAGNSIGIIFEYSVPIFINIQYFRQRYCGLSEATMTWKHTYFFMLFWYTFALSSAHEAPSPPLLWVDAEISGRRPLTDSSSAGRSSLVVSLSSFRQTDPLISSLSHREVN